MTYLPIIGTLVGILALLFFILRLKWPAFLSLLIASILAGLVGGMEPSAVLESIQKGMGGTLGFVATIVGLGALFGAILEHSGGAQAIAQYLLRRFGVERAPLSMVLTGFIVAIPVFFDVAFIILIPVIYAVQQRTGKSLLLYAIPLLAGLAATHAFIPPTPGPIAVADILGASLGWVILVGFLAGVPTVLVAGLWFGRYIAKRIPLAAPDLGVKVAAPTLPPVGPIFSIIALPIVLILLNTLVDAGLILEGYSAIQAIIAFVGHPFSALIIANLVAWYWLGIGRGFSAATLLDVSTKSLAPAGVIILLTGAGGVFKQILIDTGAGKLIAESMVAMGLPIIVFAFLAAALVRIAQGSATVAMITGASLVAPLLINQSFSNGELAALTIAIAAGASILSHVNDSGFWLVQQYLGMTEQQAFRSWTVMTTILAVVGFAVAWFLFVVL
ncbi:MAG: gluconate:H+ symporter [Bacteroidota bacterium]